MKGRGSCGAVHWHWLRTHTAAHADALGRNARRKKCGMGEPRGGLQAPYVPVRPEAGQTPRGA